MLGRFGADVAIPDLEEIVSLEPENPVIRQEPPEKEALLLDFRVDI